MFVQKGQKIPSAPAEGWLSNGRQVLHLKPATWNQWQQELEITSGQVLLDQPVPSGLTESHFIPFLSG